MPKVAWLETLGIVPQNREYAFHDTKLHPNIQNAFQALALDEQRGPFSPAVWEKPDGSPTVSVLDRLEARQEFRLVTGAPW